MPANLRARILSPLRNSQLHPFVLHNPLSKKLPKPRQIQTRMTTQSGSTKRPTCPTCSKPTRICLCTRLRNPPIHNSVAVTILQHSLEKNHPLNSTRIATIGLKNVHVVTVSDVNFQARFLIRSLGSGCSSDGTRHAFDEMPMRGDADELMDIAINFTVGKYGAIMAPDKCQEMSFDELFASCIDADGMVRKGFVVKKLGTKLSEGSDEYEESEDFEIVVPRGSVLLFPSERSVDVEAVDFEVKNLIVLDGTWAKAKRMYNENPWLRLLPHVRLNLDKLSLYSEVRHQPKAGYLSTIESVVYAMKVLGEEDAQGLDCLLDVFESMVGDQRRCKNERLSRVCEEVSM